MSALTLFLERISPGPLVLRVHKSNMTSQMLHAELLGHDPRGVRAQCDAADLRERPCLGPGEDAARRKRIRIINIAYEQTGPSTSGTALSQRVFEVASRLSHLPTQEALLAIREEVRKLF